jgi:hypothetical protein
LAGPCARASGARIGAQPFRRFSLPDAKARRRPRRC